MTKKCSISADEKIWEIADTIAKKKGMSRSELFQHLVVYAGLVGGEYPLTTQILSSPQKQRDQLLAETLKRTKDDEPLKKQEFWKAVARSAKNASKETAEEASKSLLKVLIGS